MIKTVILRLLKRSTILRFLIFPLLFLIFVLALSGLTFLMNRKPVLESVSPAIAEPGEVIVLQGKHFGTAKGDNWIQLAGSRISGTSYIKWTDTTIMVLLPTMVEDGLIHVVNRNGKSNPLIFANKNNIPIATQINTEQGLPEITSFDTINVEIGKRLIISGKNFGITKNKSTVLFTWQLDPTIPYSPVTRANQSTIACAEHDFDYELWSDQELRIRVPDGATSGNVIVQTERGASNPMAVNLVNQSGIKKYTDRHTYLLSLNVDISGVSASEGNMLFLRIPIPETTSQQRNVEVTASAPKPFMDNYKGNILHQFENLKSGKNEKIAHSFLLTNYGITTAITPSLVKPYSDRESPLYLMYTKADRIVPSDNQDLIIKANSIIGSEKNPYIMAKLIYSWLTENIQLTAVASPDRPVLEALSSQKGDAYDLAILFSAFTRAVGIPSLPVAGILVDSGQNARNHWWAEFYIESFGWVPCDPGIAVSPTGAEKKEWYFGNLDAYHIAFSRGWTDAKPMTPKSKIVYKPRSFAFQPMWEESGGNIKSYTSFWGEPTVTGVY